jgi:hypothetical protein
VRGREKSPLVAITFPQLTHAYSGFLGAGYGHVQAEDLVQFDGLTDAFDKHPMVCVLMSENVPKATSLAHTRVPSTRSHPRSFLPSTGQLR